MQLENVHSFDSSVWNWIYFTPFTYPQLTAHTYTHSRSHTSSWALCSLYYNIHNNDIFSEPIFHIHQLIRSDFIYVMSYYCWLLFNIFAVFTSIVRLYCVCTCLGDSKREREKDKRAIALVNCFVLWCVVHIKLQLQ